MGRPVFPPGHRGDVERLRRKAARLYESGMSYRQVAAEIERGVTWTRQLCIQGGAQPRVAHPDARTGARRVRQPRQRPDG